MNDASRTKMWEEIRLALQENLHGPAEDERTIRQLAEEWGTKRDRTYSLVNQLIEAKVLLSRKDGQLIYVRPNPDIENVAGVILEKVFRL